MVVRTCGMKDEKIWIQMNREFMDFEIQDGQLWNNANEGSDDELQRTFSEAMAHPELVTLMLIEIDGEPVGFANLMTIFSVWAHGKALILDDLFIREAYRGHGLGKEFMLYLEDYARGNGFRRLQFQSEYSNPGARAFYGKLGYKSADMHFYVKYLADS